MADNRRQKRKHNSSDNNKITRRLRIMYTDPDATDSSSEENYQKPKKIKRIVQELPLPNTNIEETSNESCDYMNKDNKVDVRRQPTRKYRGVRMRKWGSWASEIRNPMVKSGREWIGTFSTAEEASQAYEKRYIEIREEMANAEKMKKSGNSENNNSVNNVIMATTNQEKSNNDYFVSSDSLDDSKSNTMSHTTSSLLPELNTLDCNFTNLIDVGNISSNEAAIEANILGGEFAKLKDEFAKLDRPDLSVFNMQPLSLPPPTPTPSVVRAANPCWFEFDCFGIDGFENGHEYDDLGDLEDIKICGIDDKDPCGIPDFDFADFGVDDITYGIEEPLFL